MATTLYGRSDVQAIKVGKHTHVFAEDAKDARFPVPAFGNENRSLPVLTCPECTPFAVSDGWATHPDRVQKTSDELEYEENSQRTGNMFARTMADSFGRQMATSAREEGRAPDATPAPARKARARKGNS
jgi:hypothetical protein